MKKNAPEDLKEGVFNGDITTNKQYQEEIKARKEAEKRARQVEQQVKQVHRSEKSSNKHVGEVESSIAKNVGGNNNQYLKSIYVLKHRGFEDYYKIGVTHNINQRLNSLNTASPLGIEVVFNQVFDSPYAVESIIHSRYEDRNTNGEWFNFSKKEIERVTNFIKGFSEFVLTDREYYMEGDALI